MICCFLLWARDNHGGNIADNHRLETELGAIYVGRFRAPSIQCSRLADHALDYQCFRAPSIQCSRLADHALDYQSLAHRKPIEFISDFRRLCLNLG
jgi:hypothetical protein